MQKFGLSAVSHLMPGLFFTLTGKMSDTDPYKRLAKERRRVLGRR